MRVGLVRNVGLSITALAVLALGGCDSNPLDFDVKDTAGIQVNPSAMVVPAGRTAKLESRAVNKGDEPTFDQVAAAIDATCGQAAITVEPDPAQLDIQPPGLFVVTGGALLGETCITLTSGSNTAQVEVTVVTDGIAITAPAPGATYRAGETDQVVATLIDFAGNTVGPYAPEDAVFASDDPGVVDFTDDMGTFATTTTGTANLEVTWAGQAFNGTAGLGVVRTADVGIEVIANVPASAAFDFGGNPDFGAIAGGSSTEVEVVVSDALGNQNTVESEITACAVLSDDATIATATCALVLGNSVNVMVTVAGVSPGTANISGSVTTSEGPLAFGPAPVVVLAPFMIGLAPVNGFVGTVVQITGTGLVATGFDTDVTVDGAAVDPIFIISATDTQIDAFMPDVGDANDQVEIGAAVGGVPTPTTITYTQLGDGAADEPANDDPSTPTVIPIPSDLVGSFEGNDVDDFYLVTLAADGTFTVDLDWDDHSVDLDILIDDEGLPFAFPCGFDGATGAAPEQHVCTVPAGNYLVWINNYSGPASPTSYRLEIQ